MADSNSGADKVLDLIGMKNGYVLDYIPEGIKETHFIHEPIEGTFSLIAINYPEVAIKLVESNTMSSLELTWLAEHVGEQEVAHAGVEDLLIKLSEHSEPIVREGALYGIDNYLINRHSDILLKQLEKLMTHEHKTTAEIAKDTLLDYKDI